MKHTAEIVCIGNELLIGQTLDTNSNWIARKLTKFGWTLQRVTLLRDSSAEISQGLVESIKRAPELLITLGGLGPTHDDMTLRGLSRAVGRPLVVNEKALDIVNRRYRSMVSPPRLTRFRKKMAILPSKSEPLFNPVGTAPGVLTRRHGTLVVSLPGVPEEMKAIFKGSVIPLLKKSNSESPEEAYVRIIGMVESALAPILEKARRRFPTLYFKSHPRGRETGISSLILLHIYTISEVKDGRIAQAVAFLVKALT